MKYDFILFDADGTLFDFERAEHYSFETLCHTYNFPFSEELYADYHVINDGLWKAYERGEIEKPSLLVERYRRLIDKYGFDADAAECNAFYLKTLGSCPYLLDGAMEICEHLAAKKPLYLVTNGEASVQQGRFNGSPIKKYFTDIFISGSVGYPKPHKEYFDYVAKNIEGFDPARAIIIGDSLTSDIKGGNNAGIDTVWFNPKGEKNDKGVKIDYEIKDLNELIPIILGE